MPTSHSPRKVRSGRGSTSSIGDLVNAANALSVECTRNVWVWGSYQGGNQFVPPPTHGLARTPVVVTFAASGQESSSPVVKTARPGERHERNAAEKFSVGAIQYIVKSVAVSPADDLAFDTIDHEVGEDRGLIKSPSHARRAG